MILLVRTDNPEAEVGLFDGDKELVYEKWQAHRELSQTILQKIENHLEKAKKEWSDISGVVLFEGPGSFTGLRIGASVANTLAESLNVPVVGTTGDDWTKLGIEKIKRGENDKIVIPQYGRPARITQPRK